MPSTADQNNVPVMIVAGESSGDLHGGNLLQAAAKDYSQLEFFGVGGARMRDAGCRIVFPSEELAVMGFSEVLGRLPALLARFRQLKKILQGPDKPRLLVLIDFPDFNLRLAKVAKAAGVPVLYYICPKVWAWRSGRAKIIAERADQLALIFPFEPQIYTRFGVQAEYVGNPLLDEFSVNQPQGDLRQELAIGTDEQVVGIFPGSRQNEIQYNFSTLLETAQLLVEQKPQLKFLLPIAPSLQKKVFEQAVKDSGLPVQIVDKNIYEVAAACNAVLTVSGTVTLQISLVGTPLAILYKMAPLNYSIAKRVVKVEHVGLTNIVAGRGVVREFIQEKASPENLSREVCRLLDDSEYAQQMRTDLAGVRRLLGQPGSSARVARMIAEMCHLAEVEG